MLAVPVSGSFFHAVLSSQAILFCTIFSVLFCELGSFTSFLFSRLFCSFCRVFQFVDVFQKCSTAACSCFCSFFLVIVVFAEVSDQSRFFFSRLFQVVVVFQEYSTFSAGVFLFSRVFVLFCGSFWYELVRRNWRDFCQIFCFFFKFILMLAGYSKLFWFFQAVPTSSGFSNLLFFGVFS